MKSALRYSIIVGIGLLGIAFVFFYQQYLGEDADPKAELPSGSIIHKRLNAIVTDTSRSQSETSTFAQALKIAYVDQDTRETSSFVINYPDRIHVGIGDTVTKDKGEKLVLIYRQRGTVTSVPVE
jgi:hypothetical protein